MRTGKATVGVKIFGLVFCLLLTVGFTIGAFLALPQEGEYLCDLSRREIRNLPEDKTYYRLDGGDYRVLDEYAVKRQASGVHFHPKGTILEEYAYYSVLIKDDDGEKLVITVKSDKRIRDLIDDDSYDLVGMISELPEEMAEAQEDSYTWDYPVETVALNVNSEKHSWTLVIFLAVMAVISFASAVLIVVRWNKGRIR